MQREAAGGGAEDVVAMAFQEEEVVCAAEECGDWLGGLLGGDCFDGFDARCWRG